MKIISTIITASFCNIHNRIKKLKKNWTMIPVLQGIRFASFTLDETTILLFVLNLLSMIDRCIWKNDVV